MAEATAGIVFTGNQGGRGDNSGGAAILDNYGNFTPTLLELDRRRREEDALEYKRKEDAKKAWTDISNKFDPSGVQLRDTEEIAKRFQEWHGELTKIGNELAKNPKTAGDATNTYYGPLGLNARQMEAELKNMKKASIDNQAADAEYQKAIEKAIQSSDPDFDVEYAVEWMKKYRAAPSIAEQTKMRTESSPIRRVFRPNQIIKRVGVVTKETTNENGNITTTEEMVDTDKFKQLMYADLQYNPASKTEYQAWKDQQQDQSKTSPDDYVDFMAKLAASTKKGITKTTLDEPRVSSSGDGGGGGWQDKLSIQMETGNFKDLVQGETNTIDVKRKGTNDDLPPIEIVDQSGAGINFQPVRFLKTPSGWKVYGKKITYENEMFSTIGQDGNMIQVPTGKKVPSSSYVMVDYDQNHGAFVAQMNGFDIYKDVEKGEEKPTQQSGTTKVDYSKLKKKR